VGKSTLVSALAKDDNIDVLVAEHSLLMLIEYIEEYSNRPSGDHTKHLIIDQAERLQYSLSCAEESQITRFQAQLEAIRRSGRGIVFSIRADCLGPLLGIVAKYHPSIHYVRGIQFEQNSTALQSVMARLDSFDLTQRELQATGIMLTSAHEVNSFAFQVGGYLLESLSRLERKRFLRGISFDKDVISSYIEIILAEYSSRRIDPDRKIHIEAVLFVICLYNRRYSLPVHNEEIAQVSCMPVRYVEEAVEFLIERRVVERSGGSQGSVFVSHDLISAELLDNQPRHMREDHRAAISELINNVARAKGKPLIHPEVNPFRRIFTAHASGPFVFSLSLVFIWVAAVSYAIRLNSREFGLWLSDIVPSTVLRVAGGVDITTATYMFFPITFTLYCWILFMYGLDRGYFYYLREEGGIARWTYSLVQVAGPVGIVVGLVSSVAPAIFPLGVVIPGSLIALAYFNAVYRSKNRNSVHARYTFRFGWQTIINMIISIAASYLISRIVLFNGPAGRNVENVVIITSIAFIYVLFAYAMLERQGSETGRWVLLAIFRSSKVGRTEFGC
jgi:hypothetical protein